MATSDPNLSEAEDLHFANGGNLQSQESEKAIA
jgi:hypothetical protein